MTLQTAIETLQRRRAHLLRRIEQRCECHADSSYDQTEAGAIALVLKYVTRQKETGE